MPSKHSKDYPKNLLSIALGQVLKRKRELYGFTSTEIAELIGLGSSYYRLIESGNNNLHISNTFKLTDAFQGTMHLNAISTYISLMYHVESVAKEALQMEEKSESNVKDILIAYSNAYKNALAEISQKRKEEKLDSLFKKLINSEIFTLLSNREYDEIEKELFSSGFIYELETFLFDYNDYRKPKDQQQDEYLTKFLNDIPSIYLEYLSESRDSLMRLPVTIGWQGLWEWEDESKKKFKSLIAAIKEVKLLNNQDNLDRYKYKYLWEDNFQQLRFIYFDDEDPRKVKEEFMRLLKNSLGKDSKTKPLLKTLDEKMQLVEFKHCPKSKFDSSIFKNDEEEHNATWIFTLQNKSNIGFAAKINPEDAKMTEGVSLPYYKTKRNLMYLEKLWDTI